MLHYLNSPKKEKEAPKILSDPKIIGPGIWVELHLKARKATTESKKEEFVNHMMFLAETFPCLNCKKHINEYLSNNPIKDYWNLQNEKGEYIGMFKWTVIFHNAVNTRLGKPYMDWDTAWEMYDVNVTPCTKDCGENEEELPELDIGNFNHISTGNLNNRSTNEMINQYFIKKGLNENISLFL